MASGLYRNGTDFDSIFMARVNAKIADVGIKSNGGVDISNRYEARGTATAVANTGFTTQGTDLAQLFRDINAPLGPPAPPSGVFPSANFVIEAYAAATNSVGWSTGQTSKINPSSPYPKAPYTSNSGAGQLLLFYHNYSNNTLYLSYATVPSTPNPVTGPFVRFTVKDLTTLGVITYLRSGAASIDEVPTTTNYTWSTTNTMTIGRQYQVEFFNS